MTPFTHVQFMLRSRMETRRGYLDEGMSTGSPWECLIQAIVRAQVNRKGVYMTSFTTFLECDFAFMLPPESAFCSNHDRKRTCLGVLNRRFETRLFDNTAWT